MPDVIKGGGKRPWFAGAAALVVAATVLLAGRQWMDNRVLAGESKDYNTSQQIFRTYDDLRSQYNQVVVPDSANLAAEYTSYLRKRYLLPIVTDLIAQSVDKSVVSMQSTGLVPCQGILGNPDAIKAARAAGKKPVYLLVVSTQMEPVVSVNDPTAALPGAPPPVLSGPPPVGPEPGFKIIVTFKVPLDDTMLVTKLMDQLRGTSKSLAASQYPDLLEVKDVRTIPPLTDGFGKPILFTPTGMPPPPVAPIITPGGTVATQPAEAEDALGQPYSKYTCFKVGWLLKVKEPTQPQQ